MKTLYIKLLNFCGKQRNKSEDRIVLSFFTKLSKYDKKIEYLEVGSGLGRFVDVIKNRFNFNITAVEINSELAEKTSQMGVNTLNINFVENNFPDESFDVVHCSHVIEHIPYPAIVDFLDELFRITKSGGNVIIRSPLMSNDFFTCIDHIRPYPPKTILDYYSNPQQQRTGKYRIVTEKIRLRRSTFAINSYSYNPFWRAVNLCFKILHSLFKVSLAKPDGYVAIFLKEKI